MMNVQFNNPNQWLIERQVKAESEARLAQHEAEMELLMALFAEEEALEEDITVEDVEFELMAINDFRGFVLDINEDEVEWINNNVDLKHLLGTDEDTVQALSKKLNLSVTKVRRMVRAALGYKRGSDYQNEQRQYVDEVIEDFRHNLYEELEHQLKKARLYDFYRALLDYVKNRVSVRPLSKDENELTFFIMYPELIQVCREFGITRGLDSRQLRKKLEKLCELGLLTNLEDRRIDYKALAISKTAAKKSSDKMSKVTGKEIEINRKNHYVLNDLSPEIQDVAVTRIRLSKDYGIRSKDKNSTLFTLVYGEDTQKEITPQGQENISDTKLRNFKNAAQKLIDKQGYFTEEQLRVQYLKKDHHMKSKDSYHVTATYLSKTAMEVKCIKTRVNKEIREQYNLPKKIKPNSFIYVPKK
jgi:hypothetical protein